MPRNAKNALTNDYNDNSNTPMLPKRSATAIILGLKVQMSFRGTITSDRYEALFFILHLNGMFFLRSLKISTKAPRNQKIDFCQKFNFGPFCVFLGQLYIGWLIFRTKF